MHIEIKDGTVEVRTGENTRGKYEIREQTGYMVTADERRRVNIQLQKGQTPFAPGAYVISDESFTVDDYGRIQIRRLTLIPAQKRAAA